MCVRLPYVSAALSFAIGQLFLPFCWMGIRVAEPKYSMYTNDYYGMVNSLVATMKENVTDGC